MAENQQERQKAKELQVIADQMMAGNDDTLTYELDLIVGQRNFKGQFVFRRPSVYEQARIGLRVAEMLSAADKDGYMHRLYTDVYHENLVMMVATLEVVVAEHPKWWDLESVRDDDLVGTLYGRYKVWQNGFRRPIQPEPAGDAGPAATEGDGVGGKNLQGAADR